MSQTIKILTKGGEEVELKLKKLANISDEDLYKQVIPTIKQNIEDGNYTDDDSDYEPYKSMFKILTGHPRDNFYDNLFEKNEKVNNDCDLFTKAEEEMDKWLDIHYPKTFHEGQKLIIDWYNNL